MKINSIQQNSLSIKAFNSGWIYFSWRSDGRFLRIKRSGYEFELHIEELEDFVAALNEIIDHESLK